jgi:hypothetical protein
VTVYVDDMRRVATVRGLRRRWSHLIADTPEELREFGTRLGLSRSWIQKAGTRVEHFDVTDAVRKKAIILGAEQISYADLPIVTARLARVRNPG